MLKQWFLLLGTWPLAATRELITWGNSSCWKDGDWRIYELCCFPIANTLAGQVEVEEEIPDFPGFAVGRRYWTGVYPSCWLGQNFNESHCCRPKGSFFKMDAVNPLPPHVAYLFNGCQAASWQSFLFKLRITGGVMWSLNTRTRNWFYDLDFGKRKARQSFDHWSIPMRGCPIGYALVRILEHYLTFLTLDQALPSEPFDVLEKAEAELKPFGGLFAAVGISWHQLQYIRLLYSLQNRHFSGKPQRPLAPALPSAGGLALDVGASQGVDAEMMLRQGLQVVAVEGNAVALQHFRERMAKETSPIATALTMVHAATGGSSVPAVVEFQVDDHHAEKSFIFDAKKDTPLVDATMTRVPQKSCGALYRHFVPHSAVYVKIDLEGTDLECLGSLLRNGTSSGWELPRFVSIEVPPPGDVILDGMSKRWENELLGTISGSYCHAKLCRQHLYNLRGIPGLDLVSRIGWGASGPFGANAVDWRRGESWAPVRQVLNEVFAASIIARMSREWFDLHLRRC